MMSGRHSSREKIAALSLALVLLCANTARAQGGNPDPPSNPQVGNVTSTSAALSWAQGSPGVKYEVIVSPGNIFFTNLNSTSLELGSLAASTAYSWQVRSTRGNKSSNWVQGPAFTTSAAPAPAPAPPPPT
ncbi:MAG: fibronectin type III domain-containing protein, partial [Ignavibacteria bacterium]|nr:fibronectin type III domain-containing protein [Ignavibacteria bacterium]